MAPEKKNEKPNGLSRLHKWIVVFIGLGIIGSSVAGTLWAIDNKIESKADAVALEQKVDVEEFQTFVVFTRMEFVDQERRRVQNKIWDIERNFGYDCSKMPRHVATEYNQLKQQLRDIDRKISKIEKSRGGG